MPRTVQAQAEQRRCATPLTQAVVHVSQSSAPSTAGKAGVVAHEGVASPRLRLRVPQQLLHRSEVPLSGVRLTGEPVAQRVQRPPRMQALQSDPAADPLRGERCPAQRRREHPARQGAYRSRFDLGNLAGRGGRVGASDGAVVALGEDELGEDDGTPDLYLHRRDCPPQARAPEVDVPAWQQGRCSLGRVLL